MKVLNLLYIAKLKFSKKEMNIEDFMPRLMDSLQWVSIKVSSPLFFCAACGSLPCKIYIRPNSSTQIAFYILGYLGRCPVLIPKKTDVIWTVKTEISCMQLHIISLIFFLSSSVKHFILNLIVSSTNKTVSSSIKIGSVESRF